MKKHVEQRVGRQAQEIGLRLFDYTYEHGIIRFSQTYRDAVLEAVRTLRSVDGHPVVLTPKRTSGTLRSIRTRS